jgi:hypothetical protein
MKSTISMSLMLTTTPKRPMQRRLLVTTLEHAISKLGNVKPETRSIAKEIFNAAQAKGHDVYFVWGMGTSTEHSTGLALDLMVRNEAAGDWVRDYIWANRARLRLRHVIWEQHITSTVVQPGARRKMEDRGNSTANHFDHVHPWFFPGTYQSPSTSTPPKPKPPSTDAQLVVDGDLGPKTISKWQKVMGTKVDGKIDKNDSSLIRAVQKRLKATVDHRLVIDGDPGPKTFGALQRYLGVPVNQRFDSTTVKALQRRLNTNKF